MADGCLAKFCERGRCFWLCYSVVSQLYVARSQSLFGLACAGIGDGIFFNFGLFNCSRNTVLVTTAGSAAAFFVNRAALILLPQVFALLFMWAHYFLVGFVFASGPHDFLLAVDLARTWFYIDQGAISGALFFFNDFLALTSSANSALWNLPFEVMGIFIGAFVFLMLGTVNLRLGQALSLFNLLLELLFCIYLCGAARSVFFVGFFSCSTRHGCLLCLMRFPFFLPCLIFFKLIYRLRQSWCFCWQWRYWWPHCLKMKSFYIPAA